MSDSAASKPDYTAFLEAVIKRLSNNPTERVGQAYFNALYFDGFDPEFADSIRGEFPDPFYNDGDIAAFLDALRSHWYPEHEKLAAVQEESQAIGEFLDGIDYVLCRLVQKGNNGEPRWIDVATGEPTERGGFDAEWNPAYEEWGDHYQPIGSIQDVLAEYFGIDRDALEREKRAMLDALRSRS